MKAIEERYAAAAAHFGGKIAELLEDKEISMRELARQTGVSNATISRLISGKSRPDGKTIVAMACYFDVSADWLLGIGSQRKRE